MGIVVWNLSGNECKGSVVQWYIVGKKQLFYKVKQFIKGHNWFGEKC